MPHSCATGDSRYFRGDLADVGTPPTSRDSAAANTHSPKHKERDARGRSRRTGPKKSGQRRLFAAHHGSAAAFPAVGMR